MDIKIFISYTLQDGHLNIDFLKSLKSVIVDQCFSYIDILDNGSRDKQARVEEELISSDYLILIKTMNIDKSDWVKKEILIAKENSIPIVEFDYQILVEREFQPITLCISHWVGLSFHVSASSKIDIGRNEKPAETPNDFYT
jgi:hypothetical protein